MRKTSAIFCTFFLSLCFAIVFGLNEKEVDSDGKIVGGLKNFIKELRLL